jgi:hypothetical protein
MSYQPPYTIISTIISLIAEISENIGRLSVLEEQQSTDNTDSAPFIEFILRMILSACHENTP